MNQSLKVTKRKKIYEKLQNLTPRLTIVLRDEVIRYNIRKIALEVSYEDDSHIYAADS